MEISRFSSGCIYSGTKVSFLKSNVIFPDWQVSGYGYSREEQYFFCNGDNIQLKFTDGSDDTQRYSGYYYRSFNEFSDLWYYEERIGGGSKLLSMNEWAYLLNTHEKAYASISPIKSYPFNDVGYIGGNYDSYSSVAGLIVLPHDFILPDGCSFSANATFDYDDPNRLIYTVEQWKKMEAAGALFLPLNTDTKSKFSGKIVYMARDSGTSPANAIVVDNKLNVYIDSTEDSFYRPVKYL